MFLDEFEPLYEVYSNELAQVYVAKRYNNGREVTVKVLQGSSRPKTLHEGVSVPNEILLLQRLDNCRVVKWEEFFFEAGDWFLILEHDPELMPLDQFIKQSGGLNEEEARHIMHQLYNTVTYCLLKDVDHCHITLENILIHPDSLDIKLTNFDLAMDLELSEKGVCGHSEEGYLPPEYFMIGEYEPFAATTWALGNIIFELIFGFKAHCITNTNKLSDLFRKISPDLVNLLTRSLTPLPKKRLTFEAMAHHTWFQPEIYV